MISKNIDIPSSILNNGKCNKESATIANIFNDFFHSAAPVIQSKIKFSCKSFNEYLPSKNYDSFTITPTSKAEIDAIISSLNSNKSTGPNSIPLKILKLTQNEISQHLVHIVNLTFKTGVFPDSLKIAKVIPIHKKDSKLVVSNYRPISILSNLDKILEKLMHSRLMKFLDDQKILYLKQFGFQKIFSISHAIISLIENVQKSVDDKQIATGVFIDLEKAFDTVDHTLLLNKLSYYGIRGVFFYFINFTIH